MEAEITTKHLRGSSDLTLLAPIKAGLISTLDTRTYATRLRAALKTLHTLRQTSREYSMIRPFSDSTDRIRTITDLRMAILEDEQKLMLSVTFDRPWEPYLRIIWRDVGKQLDLIFCNCVGYPISTESSFEEYGTWVRNARTNTQFLYKASALTFDDELYLRKSEKLLSKCPFDSGAVAAAAASLQVDDPGDTALLVATASPTSLFYALNQGMQALSVLYRLADVYPPRTPDGHILLRAAAELLKELREVRGTLKGMADGNLPVPPPTAALAQRALAGIRGRFPAQLDWFDSTPGSAAVVRGNPAANTASDVQAGVLSAIQGVGRGCIALFHVRTAQAGAEFLKDLSAMVVAEGEIPGTARGGIYTNVALSPQGLRHLGLTEAQMAAFPNDFLDGMQERAGLIGDVRGNHPRNWALPRRGSLAAGAVGAASAAEVSLTSVHVVVQMRIAGSANPALEASLAAKLIGLESRFTGRVDLLAVEPMYRNPDPGSDNSKEHFKFVDGISQPKIAEPPGAKGSAWDNEVRRGEVLLGHENDAGDAPGRNALLDNGTFLVLRKLRQDVEGLEAVAQKAVDDHPGVVLTADEVKEMMMGRKLGGSPLVDPAATATTTPAWNDFNYASDKDAAKCPFAAHIRRTNPRTPPKDGRSTVPRIVRRGMSFGPQFDPSNPDNAQRGVMFMCYNASISEQFEVIQRWVSGGNSTGVFSEHSDPFLGVPQVGETRTFRFLKNGKVVCVNLDPDPAIERPLVKLDWGMYLFTPSIPALKALAGIALASAGVPAGKPLCETIEKGERIIGDLQQDELHAGICAAGKWKAFLEDGHARTFGDSEAVWAAVRERHGGVLRTPYGVLVGSKALYMQVLDNVAGDYSVKGYVERLEASIGQMYLGLDDDPANPQCEYQKQSKDTNTAIFGIPEKDAFDGANAAAKMFLDLLTGSANKFASDTHRPAWEITLDIKEISDFALTRLCELWFSLEKATSKPFLAGGNPWNWDPLNAKSKPFYPGHFTAPSRYVFQPTPGQGATELGQVRGKAIYSAMKQFVTDFRNAGTTPPGAIVSKIFAAFPDDTDGNDLLARTILGTLIGFLPTVEGNFRAVMNEWLEEKTFWDLQNAFLASAKTGHDRARDVLLEPLMRTMQFRPAPELGWRVATRDHKLGEVWIKAGDKIALGIVSATQEDLAKGATPDVYPIFGGDRNLRPHPTHACPGYKIGMGVLLGMLAALMERPAVRPTPAPLTVALSGLTTPPPTAAPPTNTP